MKYLGIDYGTKRIGIALSDEEGKLALASNRLVVKPSVVFKGDLVSYAREIVWYGRKGGKFYHSDVEVARL